MYPTDPHTPPAPQPPKTVDYLNQISTQATKKKSLKPGPKLFAIIGGVLVILVLALVITVNAVTSAQRQPIQRLAARLTTTETIVTEAQSKIKSSELRSLNSNLKIFLTNTQRDIATPLLSAGVDIKKLNDSIIAKESGSAMTDRLEDARLNAVYDRTYAREMAYQLDTIMTLMKEIYTATSSSQLKTFLTDSYRNLEPTQKAFEDFDDTNS